MLFSSTPAPHISLRIVLESKHLRMGERKRKPLRSRQLPDITEPKSKSVKTYDNAANVAGPTKNSRIKKDMTILEKVISDDERDEWEEIELRQSNSIKTEKGGESESDSDHDDDRDDADEIRLEGSIEHITEKYTFEFNDMREEYTEGICVLLRSLIQNPTKAYELAKTITLQSLVGTIVACEGGSDTFAFATVLPISKQKLLGSEDPLNALIDDLVVSVRKSASASSASTASEAFLDFVTGTRVCTTGALLHKRFSNLPIQLVGPLHINLEEDLGWAQHNHESDDSEQNDFRSMQYILLICKCSLVGGDSKLAQDGKAVDVMGNSGLLFEYFEDEIFAENAIHSFLFRAKSSATPLVAAIVPIASLKKCVNTICLLIPPIET